MKKLMGKYIGDRDFYKSVIILVIPLIIQQGITNFVNVLDNVMVGSLGTFSISAVAIVNQLLFVFNLTIFGGISGPSIFGAQFAGSGDDEGLKQTFRYKIVFGLIAITAAITIIAVFKEALVLNFLKSDSANTEDIMATLKIAKQYLTIMLFSLPPFMLVQVYSSTLRETKRTLAPMRAGVIAIFINITLNYILIFGHFGFPKLGVVGAALGTVIARYIECLYLMIYTHRSRFGFIIGAFKSLYIESTLVKKIIITGLPLLLNEVFWSVGMTIINQSYSVRGLDVVAAVNISSTVSNLFFVTMYAMGNAVCILIGQQLGAGNIKKAMDTDVKLLFFSFVSQIVVGLVLLAASPFIPLLYQVEPEVRTLVTSFIIICAVLLPVRSLIHVIYFTLRSGGKTVVTFLFDCVFTWIFPLPICFLLSRYTQMDIVVVFLLVQAVDIIKVIIGLPIIKSGKWANNIINNKN